MTAPTDLELMMYADGELEPARLAEVEAFLTSDVTARDKLAALDFAGDLLRERAEAATPSLDAASAIADLVMAKIAAGEALEDVAPKKSGADVIPMRPRSAVKARPKAAKPSESGRTIYMLAAAAVAAAAAMMLWARSEPPAPAAVAALSPERAPAEVSPSAEVAAATPSPEPEADVGVEVAAVDFGSRTGTIFYVPSAGAPGPMTTVVWLTDPAGEE